MRNKCSRNRSSYNSASVDGTVGRTSSPAGRRTSTELLCVSNILPLVRNHRPRCWSQIFWTRPSSCRCHHGGASSLGFGWPRLTASPACGTKGRVGDKRWAEGWHCCVGARGPAPSCHEENHKAQGTGVKAELLQDFLRRFKRDVCYNRLWVWKS